MEKTEIKDFAKKCMPYFNSLTKEQQAQFISYLPLNSEEFNCFLSTLLVGQKENLTQGIQLENLSQYDIDLNSSRTR